MSDIRVAVIGTGSIGAMTLWQLAERGITATGYDLYAPGHDRGAAGGDSRLFRMAYAEGSEYDGALRSARALWSSLEQESGRRIFIPCGVATVGRPDDPVAQELAASAEKSKTPLERIQPDQAAPRFGFRVDEDETVFLDPEGGILRAGTGVLAAVEVAQAKGARMRSFKHVVDVEDHFDHVRVRTSEGVEDYDAVVVAPGPWMHDLGILEQLRATIGVVTSLWFAPRVGADFTVQQNPGLIQLGEHAFSCFPAFDGSETKVNLHDRATDGEGNKLRFPQVPRMGDIQREVDPGFVALAHEAVTARLPRLNPNPVRSAVYADAFSPDHHGFLGRLTGSSRVLVGAAFSGHGFKLAPFFGSALAALVVGQEPAADISHLDPARLVSV